MQAVSLSGPAGPVPALTAGVFREARATIILRYGLGARMEVQAAEAERLRAAGYAALIPEAPHHGLRADGFLTRLEEAPEEEGDLLFLDLVERTAAETPALVASLRAQGATTVIDSGISMGGFVALASPVFEPSVRGVIAFIASPVWDASPRSPHLHPDAWARTPLLSITADADRSVPPAPMRAFVRTLGALATGLEYPGGHTMARADWDDAWLRAISWLDAIT